MPDIKEINGKYYDFAPRNESFLITAKELKSVGIKNYYFMLRIDNPRVATIDPFNPNITRQEIQLLLREYIHNIWIFMRDAVRLRTQKGVVPYGLHRGLAAAAWCFEHNQDCCLCEPRQTWKTTGTIGGPLLWAFQLSRDATFHFFGKETGNTKDNLAHLKDDITLLPKWLQFTRYVEDGKEKKSRMATERIQNNQAHNVALIHPKASSASSAASISRGQSITIAHFDEICHTIYFPIIFANSSPGFMTAHQNAVDARRPSARIFTCTPPDIDTKEGRDAYPLIKSMIPWTEKLYDMTPREIEDYKNSYRNDYEKNSPDLDNAVIDVFYMEYQYFQLRKDYDWVLDRFKAMGDRRTVRRDILLQVLRGASNSFLEPEDIEYLVSNMKKSADELLLCRKWIFKLYDHGAKDKFNPQAPFNKEIPYIIGIDPATCNSGRRGDYFAVTILNPENLRVAAEFHSQYIQFPDAFKMLQELIFNYMPRAVLAIERNAMGGYLIQALLASSLRDNIYWSIKGAEKEFDSISNESAKDRELRKLSEENNKYGTQLTHSVRMAMFELLKMHVQDYRETLCTEYLVNDLCKLVVVNGKPIADKGEHDDSLFSYLHAIYIYYTGDNLRLFGIERKAHPTYQDEVEEPPEHKMFTMSELFAGLGIERRETAPTFEEIYKRSIDERNRSTQEMIDRLPYVSSLGFQPSRPENPLATELVDIPSSFFDELNGVDYF